MAILSTPYCFHMISEGKLQSSVASVLDKLITNRKKDVSNGLVEANVTPHQTGEGYKTV